MTIDVKYSTEATASGGGRNGLAKLADGKLTVTMAAPKELGGSGAGHNPGELFALGYAAGAEKLGAMPDTATVKAKVGFGPGPGGGFGLPVQMEVSMPGVDRQVAEKIAARGHEICPYSNATRGNVDVSVVLA